MILSRPNFYFYLTILSFKDNKKLGWLGSSSTAGVFDSNGRDQAEQYLVLLGQTRHSGRIIRGGPHKCVLPCQKLWNLALSKCHFHQTIWCSPHDRNIYRPRYKRYSGGRFYQNKKLNKQKCRKLTKRKEEKIKIDYNRKKNSKIFSK